MKFECKGYIGILCRRRAEAGVIKVHKVNKVVKLSENWETRVWNCSWTPGQTFDLVQNRLEFWTKSSLGTPVVVPLTKVIPLITTGYLVVADIAAIKWCKVWLPDWGKEGGL